MSSAQFEPTREDAAGPPAANRRSATRIPFNRPAYPEAAWARMRECLEAWHVSGDGAQTRACHGLLEEALGVEKVLLTTSCTHALEMTADLLGVGPGDEVVVPSFTFVSTANAFVLRGARPVFADVRPDTLNLDETCLERHLTKRTRAVVPVHYAGVGCAMAPILELARDRGIAVVEDAAHALFGRYRGHWLGTLGDLGTFSFHETKNFTSGEGGALVLPDARHAARAEVIREKGTDRSRFFRGEVDKYGWIDVGSSYLPSDLLAAILRPQLEAWQDVQSRRRAIWERYRDALAPWAERVGATLPVVPEDCEPAWHMFHLLMPDLDARARFIRHMREADIWAVFHYLPLHASPMGRRFGGRPGDCPVTEDVSDRLVRLPFFNDLRLEEQARVVDRATAFSG